MSDIDLQAVFDAARRGVLQNKIDLDDTLRWLGSRKPMAFAWYGLALLEVAAAIFIVVKAYIMYDTQISEEVKIEDVVELLRQE